MSQSKKTHSDRIREGLERWRGMPPGIPQVMVRQFERRINRGMTISDLTRSAALPSYLVSNARFNAHCDLHPAWGKRIRKLSDANSNKKKGS
jgi:hypothetical protein